MHRSTRRIARSQSIAAAAHFLCHVDRSAQVTGLADLRVMIDIATHVIKHLQRAYKINAQKKSLDKPTRSKDICSG